MRGQELSEIKVAIRSSPLSQAQFSEFVQAYNALLFKQTLHFVPVLLESPGDRDKKTSLLDGATDEDFFTRDLDLAVLKGECDCALHSAKDLPWPLAQGLSVWALSLASLAHDQLCSKHNYTWQDLPHGARVATSSPTRRDGMLALRPDLDIVGVRGTIAERLSYLQSNEIDAIVVAACALKRLNLPPGTHLPLQTHPLQGQLALVGRQNYARMKQNFAGLDVRKKWGAVSLVGAGPGNAELISQWGKKLVDQADLVFFDALLDLSLIAGIKAETVYVGKRKKVHEKKQDEINQIMYEAALEGKNVVRLKGGDPLVFGRGSEEAAFLGRRLVDYQLIPGISSAQAAAAFAGIPLSERGKATSVSLINAWPAEKINWTYADTNVFFMASEAREEIRTKAFDAGLSDKTNFVWVRNAAAKDQITKLVSLAELPSQDLPEGDGPILLIGGPTVDQRAGNDWFDRQPRVLWTGPDLATQDQIKRLGIGLARVTHLPFIAIQPLNEQEIAAPALTVLFKEPMPFDWLIFTSRHTVEAYTNLLKKRTLDLRLLHGVKVAAIGQTTKAALAHYGLIADLTAEQEDSQGLVEAFCNQNQGNQRILLPRSDKALDLIPRLLSERSHQVACINIYHTVEINQASHCSFDELERYDHVVFTSPSTVESFFASFPELDSKSSRSLAWWKRVLVHCRGRQTQAALDSHL